MSTGIFIRVLRDGRWQNVLVEDMTTDELHARFTSETAASAPWKWIAMLAKIAKDRDAQATEALSFIEDNEFGDHERVSEAALPQPKCLDCGAFKGEPHSEDCRWLGIMKRGGRR